MVRHFLILENSETEFSVDPRNGRRNNTTRSSLEQGTKKAGHMLWSLQGHLHNFCRCFPSSFGTVVGDSTEASNSRVLKVLGHHNPLHNLQIYFDFNTKSHLQCYKMEKVITKH